MSVRTILLFFKTYRTKSAQFFRQTNRKIVPFKIKTHQIHILLKKIRVNVSCANETKIIILSGNGFFDATYYDIRLSYFYLLRRIQTKYEHYFHAFAWDFITTTIFENNRSVHFRTFSQYSFTTAREECICFLFLSNGHTNLTSSTFFSKIYLDSYETIGETKVPDLQGSSRDKNSAQIIKNVKPHILNILLMYFEKYFRIKLTVYVF